MTTTTETDTMQIAIRLPKELIERIDRVATAPDRVANPLFRFRVNRSVAIRALLTDAVERVEQSNGTSHDKAAMAHVPNVVHKSPKRGKAKRSRAKRSPKRATKSKRGKAKR